MATPPVFVSANATTLNTGTSPKSTSSFAVQAGDILVSKLLGEEGNNGTAYNADPSNSIADAFTEQEEVVVGTYCYAKVSTATAGSSTNITGTFTRTAGTNSLWFGGYFFAFRGSDGIGASEKTNVASGAPSLDITTQGDNSAIIVMIGDYNAGATTGKTWRTVNSITPTAGNGFEIAALAVSQYTYYFAYYPDAGAAGLKTVGMTLPSGQKYTITAIEVKGTAGGGTVNTEVLDDAISVTDSAVSGMIRNRLLQSLLSLSDEAIATIIGSSISNIVLSDTITLSDSAVQFFRRNRLLESALTVTEGSTVQSTETNIIAEESIDVGDSLLTWARRNRLLQDDVVVSDQAIANVIAYLIYLSVLTSNIAVTDEALALRYFRRLVESNTDLTDQAFRNLHVNRTQSDSIDVNDEFVAWLRLNRRLEDTVDVTDDFIANAIGYIIFTSVLTSQLTITDQALPLRFFERLLDSNLLTSDQSMRAMLVARDMLDTVEVADESMTAMKRFILLSDAISLDDSLSALLVVPFIATPVIRIGFDQPRIELGGYGL